MNSSIKLTILFIVIFAMGVGLVFWKQNHILGFSESKDISKEDMELLVSDFPPQQLQQLAATPDAKKQISDSLSDLLAIASEAEKQGYANSPTMQEELKYAEKAVLALSYDKLKNGNEQMAPLSMIPAAEVAQFWGEDPDEAAKKAEERRKEMEEAQKDPAKAMQKQQEEANNPKKSEEEEDKNYVYGPPKGWFGNAMSKIGLGELVSRSQVKQHEREFKKYIEAQNELQIERGMREEGSEMSPDQIDQLKDAFARISIYADEANSKWDELDETFKNKVKLQSRIQQSQILATMYSQTELTKQLDVTPEEVDKYIQDHPELTKESKTKADEVLKKALAGEDFGALAKEYSQDPGSKDKGGLYNDVPMGQMIPKIEKAVLSLEPGEIDPNIVETDFGFHIIKLESKGDEKEVQGKKLQVYSFRHVLVSTAIKDTSGPAPQDVPLKQWVTNKLKQDKQDEILAEIRKNNPVTVASDFNIPTPKTPQLPQMPNGIQPNPEGAPPQQPQQPEAPPAKESVPKDKK